jgi:hypothetical protein
MDDFINRRIYTRTANLSSAEPMLLDFTYLTLGNHTVNVVCSNYYDTQILKKIVNVCLMLSCINGHERYLWRLARFLVWYRTVYMDSIVLQGRHQYHLQQYITSIQIFTYLTLGNHTVNVVCSNYYDTQILKKIVNVWNECFTVHGMFDRQYSNTTGPMRVYTSADFDLASRMAVYCSEQSRWHLMLSCINRHERYLWRFARFPVWDRTVYMDSIVLQVRHQYHLQQYITSNQILHESPKVPFMPIYTW